MRWTSLLLALFVGAVLVGCDEVEEEVELELAEACDEELCKLPNCRCSSTNIPGGLAARDTPQFVTLTFDDGVNINNILTYRDLLYGRNNSNGCPVGTTFYVNHEYTNYQLVNELYNNGFEIALHSMSHQTPQDYWTDATYDTIKEEIADQRVQMSHFANIPLEAVSGFRSPFLQLSGNNSFQVLKDYGLTYDCSWPTITYMNPGLWPYTLDYASTQDCQIPPCPSASIPGVWVQPMVSWSDLFGVACSMVDACFFIPDRDSADDWFRFILSNFERHYLNNRAPFGFYVHEWYITVYPGVREALVRFLDLINNLNDVFMVNSNDVIEWIKDPVPIDEYRKKPCRTHIPTTCPATTCGPLTSSHNQYAQYYFSSCNTCPSVYPWLGNPLGLNSKQ